MFGVLKTSVAQSGLVEGAYAGLSASIMRQMTYSLVRFGVYDTLKNEIASRHPGKKVTVGEMALAASVAGGMGGLAGNPADVVLVRMTGDAIKEPSKRYGYNNWSVSLNLRRRHLSDPPKLRRRDTNCARGRSSSSVSRSGAECCSSNPHER